MVAARALLGHAGRRRAALIAEVEAGARHFALCNYVGFLSRADAPAATAALLEVVRRVRARFPALAAAPALL